MEDHDFQTIMAEYAFLQQGLRQVQVQRDVFLGSAVATAVALSGVLATKKFQDADAPAALSTMLAAIVLTAQLLTVRNTWDVVFHATYIRLFIEPKLPELQYQTDLEATRKFGGMADQLTGARFGYSITYALLSCAPVILYATLVQEQSTIGYIVVSVASATSLAVSARLFFSRHGKLLGFDPAQPWKRLAEERAANSTA